MRVLLWVLVLIGSYWLDTVSAKPIEAAPEGKVRFFNQADTDFDPYTLKPNAARQNWMRNRFDRMLVYSPYFDERLQWFPNSLVYVDSYAIYEGSPLARQHPEWIMKDEQGRSLYIPWNCKNGRCDQFAGDFSNPDFKAYMLNQMKALLAKGYRGLWLDDVNLTWRVSDGHGKQVIPIDKNTGKPMTLTAWQNYFADYVTAIREAFPNAEISHNAIWHAHPEADENPAITRQIKAADYITLERGGSDRGLVEGKGPWGFEKFLSYIDYVHRIGAQVILMDYGTTPKERDYGLASWLLISQGRDLMSSNQLDWTAPDRWWPGYSLNLGKALGARYKWRGLLRRDFQCGMVLLNQPSRPEFSLKPAGSFKDIAGRRVKQARLSGKNALILQKSCT